MNPREAVQVAVTRRAPNEGAGAAWLPGELIDLPTALACYTTGGAYANFLERDTGSIEAGKLADIVVLDRNLFETPPHQIHKVKVLLTLLGGREVFRDSSFGLGK